MNILVLPEVNGVLYTGGVHVVHVDPPVHTHAVPVQCKVQYERGGTIHLLTVYVKFLLQIHRSVKIIRALYIKLVVYDQSIVYYVHIKSNF